MLKRGFKSKKLDSSTFNELNDLSRLARGDILTMTTLAGCGHPGGSMSSIDMYSTLFSCANIFPENPRHPDRDRIVISHGHTSPGVYAALARTGFFSIEDAFVGFRKAGTIFDGHVERSVPGIEWGTGNLGQGLSAGCGFALALRLKQKNCQTFVVMGDGEQQKGQISEARRFAVKYKLNNITVLIDNNKLQISGNTHDIMPQNIKENFQSDGWKVIEIDGHDFHQIYESLYAAVHDTSAPVAIIANTVMGKGISFMENVAKYHGVALKEEEYVKAINELCLNRELNNYKEKRKKSCIMPSRNIPSSDIEETINIVVGEPICYGKDEKLDNRSAFGNALKDLAELNKSRKDSPQFAVFDCDLADSVKVSGFQSVLPDNFFEVGIQEHNAATIAGALSIEGILTFYADFGVFGVCETYNQHRLNDINHSNLKLICTHIGLDVGEDGKTHQCIDYIGLFRNLFGFKTLVPADPNQTDKATRYISKTHGNFLLGMGRSKTPVILDESGDPFFGKNYEFTYGKINVVRQGNDAVIMSYGCMLHRAIQAWAILKQREISVRVLNVCCPKDLDEEVLLDAARIGIIITYEDHNIHTGLGNIAADKLISMGLSVRLRKLGISSYGLSGPPNELFKAAGLDVDSLVRTVEEEISKK